MTARCVELSLSGHQKLNIRLPSSPSPKASQALLAKEGNGGSDEKGLIVLLTHSYLILCLQMGLLASHAAPPPTRPLPLGLWVAA